MPNGETWEEEWERITGEKPPKPPEPIKTQRPTYTPEEAAYYGGEQGKPQSIPYPLEDTKTGEPIDAFMSSVDYSVWFENEPVGMHNPRTNQFEQIEPKLWEKILAKIPKPMLKGVEYAFYPFAATGMVVQKALLTAPPEEGKKAEDTLWNWMSGIKDVDLGKALANFPEEFKLYLPGGEKYQEYRDLPIWHQLALEAPAWLATMGISATALRASLAGRAGILPKVGRVALAPAAGVEKGLQVAIQQTVGRITPAIFTRVNILATRQALRKTMTAQGIKLTPQTEKALMDAYRASFNRHLESELVAWSTRTGAEIPIKVGDKAIAYISGHATPKWAAGRMIEALGRGTITPELITTAADTVARQAIKPLPALLDKWVGVKPVVKPTVTPKAVPEVKPPVEAVKPPVAITKPPEVIPKMGTKYVFNLKQFRFEPRPIELKPGISPEADKLTNLVKSAKPARELTEALKTEELGKRVGAAAGAAKATGAQKAAFVAMAKLKGELPTAAFTPPEAGLTKTEVANLFNQVKNKLLIEEESFFKWLNTDAAFRKLLAGNIPTRSEIILLEDMFGSELAKAILAKRPLSEKVWENTLDILNIPKAIIASTDFSAWLRQGAFIVTGYPGIAAKALAVDFRTFFSGKYAAEIDNIIHTGEFAPLRESAGLYLAPVREGVAVKLAAREEAFMSRFVKKIPIIGQVVKWSERAYLSTLNYMRANTFDYYAALWKNMDYSMKTYKQLATLINWATGRGPIGKLSNQVPLLNAVFFAARLQTSRVAMLFGGAKFTSPPVRKAYARMMLRFFGSVSGIVALGAVGGLWTTEKDPRSSDFAKIRIGNTRIDPWAGFRPYITVIAQLITGQRKTATGRIQDISRQQAGERFMRSKYSPAFGLVIDILKGETFLGEEMSLETESLREQFYQRLTPLFIQDMIDAIKEEGWVGGLIALPAILGVGVVTYPGSIDAYERHVKDIPEEMLMDWQRGVSLSGEPLNYRDLNVVQKNWLRRYAEEIGDEPERKEAGKYNFYEAERDTYEELTLKLNEEMQPLVDGVLQGKIVLEDYIKQSDYLRNKYFGPAAHIWRESMREKLDPVLAKNLDRWHEEETKPGDMAYEGYIELRASPPVVDGVPDWEVWTENLDEFLSRQTDEVKDYITSRRQDWINNLPEERQPIERLILKAEEGLSEYYGVPEGKERLSWRLNYPEVDAKLFLLGRVTRLQSDAGMRMVLSMAEEYGIVIPAEQWER